MSKRKLFLSNKSKTFSTVFGALVLVVGLVAGVLLVMEPQLLNQKAADVSYPKPCGRGLSCGTVSNPPKGSSVCSINSTTVPFMSCCPKGYKIRNNRCVKPCDSGLSCGSISDPPKGSSACGINSGTVPFVSCCPSGFKIAGSTFNYTCVRK